MVKLKILSLLFLLLLMACKQNNQTDTKAMLNKVKTGENLLKNIPSNFKIEKQEENNRDESTVKQIIDDLDGDGIKDKIEVYENAASKDQFDREHFGLPIKIFKGTQSGFVLWTENKNLIYSAENTCISEGFSDVVVKGNYFTVEAQTCYDYTILTHGFITFRVDNNEILLYKYGEEYFDKSNHDRNIPSKVWDQKSFGKIKFQDVDEVFLKRLKIKNVN